MKKWNLLQKLVQHIKINHPINRMKCKTHMIISVDVQKKFNKIQTFSWKTKKVGIEGNLHKLKKGIYGKLLSSSLETVNVLPHIVR